MNSIQLNQGGSVLLSPVPPGSPIKIKKITTAPAIRPFVTSRRLKKALIATSGFPLVEPEKVVEVAVVVIILIIHFVTKFARLCLCCAPTKGLPKLQPLKESLSVYDV